MKKSTVQKIAAYIQNVPELAAEYEEIAAELEKSEAKAAANRSAYEAAEKVVMAHLTNTPQTVAELYEACKDELPEGFTKSKVSYGLTHMWTNGVVKTEGKVNEYKKA